MMTLISKKYKNYNLIKKLPLYMIQWQKHYSTFYKDLSCNPYITLDYVLNNINNDWNWNNLSRNTSITFYDIQKYPNLPWNWHELSERISIYYIFESPELPWNYKSIIIHNHTITIKDILNNQALFQDWERLIAYNTRISLMDILYYSNHEDLPRVNKDITIDDILDNPILSQRSYWLSANPSITINVIKNHPEYPWVWYELSRNPSITTNDITEHPELPWDRRYVSLNPNLTMDFISDNIEKMDLHNLSQNKFKFDEKLFEKLENTRYSLKMLKVPYYILSWSLDIR